MYVVKLLGVEVECESAQDVVALATLAAATGNAGPESVRQSGPPVAPRRGRPREPEKHESRKEKERAKTVRFLRAVADGVTGIDTQAAATALGSKAPRGVGGSLIVVKRVLSEAGFNPTEVFRSRGNPGEKLWKPGARVADAIAALNSANGQHT